MMGSKLPLLLVLLTFVPPSLVKRSNKNIHHEKEEQYVHHIPDNNWFMSFHRSRNSFSPSNPLNSEGLNINCSIPQDERSTFLWRIGTSPPSYLFGTIHVPYTRVWNYIAKNAIQAFMSSKKVYFELDLTNPYTISALTSCQLLPRELNLSQVLPPNVYRRLEDHLNWARGEMGKWVTEDQEGRGIYADYLFSAITGNWERKRPIWAMLMVNGLTPSDIASRGFPVLDLYLAQLSERQKKQKGAVERVEEQCVPLNGLTYGQVVFALNKTLQQHQNIRQGKSKPGYTTDDLIHSYQCGDLASFRIFNTAQVPILTPSSELNIEEEHISEEINKYFREHLIYRRNRRMGARVVELLLNNPGESFFFVFGAGHFVGNNSVLDIIRKSGFTVEPVHMDDNLNQWEHKSNFYRGPKQSRPGTVAGTFADLSDEERTKAFLQLLEYKLKYEKEVVQKDDRFHELWQRLPAPEVNSDSDNSADINAVRESIKVWYGISNSSIRISSSLQLWMFIITSLLISQTLL